MPNTPASPASVAARLTDEEILINASRVDELSYDGEIGSCGGFSCGENSPRIEEVVAVLRDYVRIRKLANALYGRIKEYRDKHQDEVIVFRDIKCLLAEAEKGGAR